MENDTQIKHHLFWIYKGLDGRTDGTIESEKLEYKEFIKHPISIDVCNEINALISHIKTNY